MKFKKKTAMILSFALGTAMFATTAMAEVISKNGYDEIKDSMKYTAESCTTKLPNYTVDASFVIKDNGTVISSDNSISKCDVTNKTVETVSTTLHGGTNKESYHYSDRNGRIDKNSNENIYYLTEYTTPKELENLKNPFKEKHATDIEKISDAIVGNLKDSVVVTKNSDGSKQLSGTLNESQIPALINAVVSLQSKSQFDYSSRNEDKMPKITKDIFVKGVKGNMVVSKDGLIQNVLGTGTISGKDENGKEHTLTFELLGKLSNINSTTVKKPDLSGKKVDKQVQRDGSKLSNPEKYIGKYKTDILIEKEGKFQKIGEKHLDIEAIDAKNISGRYYEEYAKGYEDYAATKNDFKFSGKFNDKNLDAQFTSSSDKNIKGNLYINEHSARINFNINEGRRGNIISEDGFSRIFN